MTFLATKSSSKALRWSPGVEPPLHLVNLANLATRQVTFVIEQLFGQPSILVKPSLGPLELSLPSTWLNWPTRQLAELHLLFSDFLATSLFGKGLPLLPGIEPP